MRLLFLLLLVAASTSTSAIADIRIIDGDTVDISGLRIRIENIDTPETFRSRCERELILGLAAKQRLRELLDAGPVAVKPMGRDRYGRTLARLTVDGVDVGEALIKEGHALPWSAGPVAKAHRLATWCVDPTPGR